MPSDPPEGSHGILTPGFWADESTPYVRRILLDEAARKNEGATRFEFNMYAVVLDFDAGTATVEDLLETGSTETVGLESFLSTAEAYGDDPSVGDGATASERHPPTFRSDAAGTVEPVERP